VSRPVPVASKCQNTRPAGCPKTQNARICHSELSEESPIQGICELLDSSAPPQNDEFSDSLPTPFTTSPNIDDPLAPALFPQFEKIELICSICDRIKISIVMKQDQVVFDRDSSDDAVYGSSDRQPLFSASSIDLSSFDI